MVFFNRFPHSAKFRKKKKPRLIICTGIDYLKDFLMFFGGNKEGDIIEKLNVGILKPASGKNHYDRQYYWVKLSEKTLIVIIPFFSGRYGLNSHHLLKEMGEAIRKLDREQLGETLLSSLCTVEMP